MASQTPTESVTRAISWPLVILVGIVAGCLTTLTALDKDITDLVNLLLVLTGTGTLAASGFTAHKTTKIEANVNGKMTRLLDAAGVPNDGTKTVQERVDQAHDQAAYNPQHRA